MRNTLLTILLSGSLGLVAQRPVQLTQRGVLVMPNGFNSAQVDNYLYFNAFDPNSGWQLYLFDGESVIQATNYKKTYETKKTIESSCGGGMISGMTPFAGAVVFHVKGKTVDNGLYKIEGENITKLMSGIEEISAPIRFKDELIVEAVVMEEGVAYKRLLTINMDWEMKKGSKQRMRENEALVSEAFELNQQLYAVVGGGIVTRSESGFGNRNVLYNRVQDGFLMDNRLYFSAVKKGSDDAGLYSIDEAGHEQSHGSIVPNQNMLNPQKPVVHEGNAYFVSDPDGKGIVFYRLREGKVETIETLAVRKGIRNVQGLAVFHDQIFVNVCGKKGTGFDMLQYDGKALVERNPDYLTNIKNTTVLNDRLIYLATEMGQEALYYSPPILPPRVQPDSFSIYDYWQNGDAVGQVRAQDASGKVRYKIVSGNEARTFEIDYYSGEIKVADKSGLGNRSVPFKLLVEVENRQEAKAMAEVVIVVKKSKRLNTANLVETLLFFPDFNRKSTLTTTKLPDGQVVGIYNTDFVMIDELRVKDKAIKLGKYPPGIYLLSVQNERNLYQKIELQ